MQKGNERSAIFKEIEKMQLSGTKKLVFVMGLLMMVEKINYSSQFNANLNFHAKYVFPHNKKERCNKSS